MLAFVDCETTGLGSEDVICSLAVLLNDGKKFALYFDLINEGKKIPPSASAINNITNEMIKNKPRLLDCQTFEVLQDFAKKQAKIVAHNLPFEAAMLRKYGLEIEQDGIDTLRCTRHLIPDLESYALNFLRYEMRLYKKESNIGESLGLDMFCIQPHEARSDVIITKLLLDELLELAPLEELIELSRKPVLLQKFEFGKYAGRYIEEIAMSDRGYLVWMSKLGDLDEDMRYTLEYYL